MSELDFSSSLEALADYQPLTWQTRLYNRLRACDVPPACDLPTGLGKTSVIPIWLIAFASQVSAREPATLPRRLIYIVNRRTVVDQATHVAERLRNRILGDERVSPSFREVLAHLRNALRQATALSAEQPIAISALRGELADNEEWKADPARPAIIVGTIDMIGSKLLFSGYGDGHRMRPHHAGLIGHDSLIVHDEAHLSPAFGTLLRAIAAEQRRCCEPRRIQVIELSATPSIDQGGGDSPIRLEPEDERDPLIPRRLNAMKSLFLHEIQADRLSEHIVDCALGYESKSLKVLIYVRSPELAKGIVRHLKKRLKANANERVALLTGTVRGYERDQLVKASNVYQALMNAEFRVDETIYLVSTSAGEVGIDLDADHMVGDLTTLDSVIQRLGRVNRSGGQDRKARVDLFFEANEKDNKAKKRVKDRDSKRGDTTTKLLLENLPRREDGSFDASPRALLALFTQMSPHEREEAFAPKPAIVRSTDTLFDAWALTSIREELPGRPAVAAYLHGLTSDPPETYVAWRSEVDLLAKGDVPPQTLRDWFKRCRLEAHERLRDLTNRVARELQKIAMRQREQPIPCVVLDDRGEAELVLLQDLVRHHESAIEFRTLILPVEAGGLTSEGILDGSVKEKAHGTDVAEAYGKRARVVVKSVGNTYSHHRLTPDRTDGIHEDSLPVEQEFPSVQRAAARIAQSHRKVVSEIIRLTEPLEGDEDEGEARYLVLLVEPKQAATEDPESAGYKRTPTLDKHSEQAALMADKIGTALKLQKPLHNAIVSAARWHDSGKNRRLWQRAVFNDDGDVVLAKSGPKGMDWRRLGGYRHEFGSLLDAARDNEVLSHAEADLILHLIAAHHGRARPHFDPDAWDTECYETSANAEAAHEVMRRYGRVQQRFGRWGLAWLESLVRCADVMASRQAAQEDIPSLPDEDDA